MTDCCQYKIMANHYAGFYYYFFVINKITIRIDLYVTKKLHMTKIKWRYDNRL